MSIANLARIRTLQERFEEAEQLFEDLAKLYPQELSPLVNLSYVLFRTDRFDKATLILKRAIEIDSEAAFPRYLMAVSQLRLARPHEAIKHLRVAVRADIRSPMAYQALGVAYVMAGDTKAAMRSFKTALALAPDMKEGVHALSNILLQRGDYKDLIELLSTYLQRQSNDIKAREILAEAYNHTREYPSARLQLTTALRYVLGDTDFDRKLRAKLLNNIGACFDQQGDTDRAMHWIERSLAVDPSFHTMPYLNLVNLYSRKRQFAQAWRVLESCKELFPENHDVRAGEAILLTQQERYDEAIELARNEVATGKATAGSYALLGWGLTEFESRPDEACKVMSEALNRFPEAPFIVNNFAYSLLMDARPVEARIVLMSARIDDNKNGLENNVVLTATWGLLYLWEGDIAKGRQHYELAEKLAHESRLKELPASVRQKMHLEMAKAFLRQGDVAAARTEIASGLEIEGGVAIYEKQLSSLYDRTGTDS